MSDEETFDLDLDEIINELITELVNEAVGINIEENLDIVNNEVNIGNNLQLIDELTKGKLGKIGFIRDDNPEIFNKSIRAINIEEFDLNSFEKPRVIGTRSHKNIIHTHYEPVK